MNGSKPGALSPVEQATWSGMYRVAPPKPHPDGKAWGNCCTGYEDGDGIHCQCLMKKPRYRASRFESIVYNGLQVMLAAEPKGRFFCIHRTDDGYHRECGGWAAKFTKNPTVEKQP